jgi:hypothetical protein
VTIVTGQLNVAKKVVGLLYIRQLPTLFPVDPNIPFFDGVDDPKVQALIALAHGCDALPGRVLGFCPSSLHKLLHDCHHDYSG